MLIVQDAIRGKLGGRQSLGWTLAPPPARVDSQVAASLGPGRPGAVLVLRLADWGSDSIRSHGTSLLICKWLRWCWTHSRYFILDLDTSLRKCLSGLRMVGNSFCEAPIEISFLSELYQLLIF